MLFLFGAREFEALGPMSLSDSLDDGDLLLNACSGTYIILNTATSDHFYNRGTYRQT